MIAGTTATALTHTADIFKKVEEKKYAHQTVAMMVYLHHMSPKLMDRSATGSVSVVASVHLEERMASLFTYVLSNLNLDWMVSFMGLGIMEVMSLQMLDMWHRHPNTVIQHHSLRLFGTLCQVHPLYCAVFADDIKAARVREAVHRMFGQWDVRELRHVLRLLMAALCYALDIPTLPAYIWSGVAKSLKAPDAAAIRKAMAEGGKKSSDQAA